MTSQKKNSTNANRKKLNLLLLFLNLVLLGLLAVFMLNRPNQSKSNQQQSQTSQSKTTAKWKTYDEPVQIPILMYHAVHVMDPSEASNANLIVDPDLFEAQIKALAKAGYYFLTPEEAYKAFTENALPAKKVVWLTFDDGVEDFYTIVYPLLKKYKMTATNNIITDFTQKEKENVLTFDQIKEMKKAGLTFESHTVNHPDLANSSLETQKNELVASKRLLDKVLDQNTSVIVYPSGRYSQVTIDQAKKADYKLGLTTKNGLASSADGLYSLKRVRILPTTTGEDLLAMIQE